MKEIVANKDLVAYCGLYCGACNKYLKEKCPGCHKNEKASWCKVRLCAIQNNYSSCADCKMFSDIMGCGKFNNFFSKMFKVLFKSDRNACIQMIKSKGYDEFAKDMTTNKTMTLKTK